MHAKPDLRVVLKMDDRWFGLGDRGRYPARMHELFDTTRNYTVAV